jgi:hypothetical protein
MGKLRGDEARNGQGALTLASARRTGLDGPRGRTLDDRRHAGTQLGCTQPGLPITLEDSVQNRDRKHYGNPDRGDEGAVENCTAARAGAGVSRDHCAARRA